MNGRGHAKSLENFWSQLKRGISGTYVSVELFYLFRYLDKQTFRYNDHRGKGDQARFELAMRNMFGERIAYSYLTGSGIATEQ